MTLKFFKKKSFPNRISEGLFQVSHVFSNFSSHLMFRIVSPPEIVHQKLQSICSNFMDFANFPSNGGIELEVVSQNSPVDLTHVDRSGLDDSWEFGTACFNTDIPYFDFDGKAFLYGHGNICDAHCEKEHIKIEDLRTCVTRYADLVVQLLENGKGE